LKQHCNSIDLQIVFVENYCVLLRGTFDI